MVHLVPTTLRLFPLDKPLVPADDTRPGLFHKQRHGNLLRDAVRSPNQVLRFIAVAPAQVPSQNKGSFTFSFTNDSGDVNGTVTGEIIGLADNATSSASAIYITSYPASLGLSLTTPYSLTPLPSSTLNKFRVFNGEVVESGFLYEIGSLALVLDNSEALLENAGSGFL
jgi:hypothetical protein